MISFIWIVEKKGDPLMKNIIFNINNKLTREGANNTLYILNNINKDNEVTSVNY